MKESLKGNLSSDNLFFFAAVSFAVGLSTSKVILSLSSALLLLAVLLNGDLRGFVNKIRHSTLLTPLLIYLGLHVIALLWTSDFGYAFNDLKTKLTLLIVPITFTLHPPDKKTIRLIINFFIASVAVTSVLNVLTWHQFFGAKQYTDIRELSLFGSHIRYGILVALSASFCVIYQAKEGGVLRLVYIVLFCWFGYYTYFSQIISGLLALTTALLSLIFWMAYQKSRVIGYSLLLLTITCIISLTYYLINLNRDDYHLLLKNLPKETVNGRLYTHNLEPGAFIDGKPVLAYLCEEELRNSWNKVSHLSYDGTDKKGQPLRFTLMRFMTDLGARKDSLGFINLRSSDISMIEQGIASREEGRGGFWARWNGVRFQLQNSMDPNGHSLLQRLEYWKTAWHIISANWLIGVGTGDVQSAFDRQYKRDKSELLPQYRLRAHNTYLTSWVSFGISGILVVIWMVISFLRHGLRKADPLAFIFMMVAVSTFFLEDTMETQVGASFFAFFFGLLSSEKGIAENDESSFSTIPQDKRQIKNQ